MSKQYVSPNPLVQQSYGVWTLQLDMAVGDFTEAVAYGQQFGAEAQLVTEVGPSGWPIVEFLGSWHQLTKLRKAYES